MTAKKWKRADITDTLICRTIAENVHCLYTLHERTGCPHMVIYRAMERAMDHGLIDYGVALGAAFLTKKGREFLKEEK